MIKNGIIQDKFINNIPVIIDLIPTSNKTSRPQRFLVVEYITIHNTGNSNINADAKMHTEYVDNATGYVSWHFTVDDKSIYQELPINEVAWHAGDGANGIGNTRSIAIEICENDMKNYAKAEENAIALIRYLIEEFNMPINNIRSHHSWSGKYCPHIILDNGWDNFIDKINNYNATKVVNVVKEVETVKEVEVKEVETSKQILKKGSNGSDVILLQKQLLKMGYDLGGYGADGSFGNATYNAVIDFQKDFDITIDGIVGNQTYGVIESVVDHFKKTRMFDTDVYLYTVTQDQFLDVDLGDDIYKHEKLSDIMKNYKSKDRKVYAGANAGFFSSSRHLGTYVDEGKYYFSPSKNFTDFIYFKDGTTGVGFNLTLLDVAQLQAKTHWVIAGGCDLTINGSITLKNIDKINHFVWDNPRTCVGQKANGEFILAVIDGRRSASKGMTARECAYLMRSLQCVNSVLYDGGGSSQLNIGDAIVNTPSDGYERSIASAFIVTDKFS